MWKWPVVAIVFLGCITVPETEDAAAPFAGEAFTVLDIAPNTLFVLEQPTDAEVALWSNVLASAEYLWSTYPELVQVWFVHIAVRPVDDLWDDVEDVGFFDWQGFSTLYIDVRHERCYSEYLMAYAVTRLYWPPCDDFDAPEFDEKLAELLDVIQGE